MAEIRTLKLNLLADVNQFSKGLRGAKGDVDSLSYKIGQFSLKAVKAFGLVVAAAGVMAVKIGKDSIKAASDLNETITKTEVIFGDASDAVIAFSKTTAKSLGISQKEALNAASTFAVFGKAAGLTGKNLTTFSTDLTKLSSDFASFFNTSPEDAITAIGAALRGESEPIRRYGILLNDATLKAKALEMGLYNGSGALDQQAKVLAAYQVILEQSTDAQGDFARTSEGLANQQRILSASIEDAKASLGESLLPVAVTFVKYLNEKVIPVVKDVIAGFQGKDGTEGLSGTALKVAKAMGYDENTPGQNLGNALRNVFEAFETLIGSLTSSKADDGVSTLDSIANSLNKIASAIENIGKAYDRYKSSFVGQLFSTNFRDELINGSFGLPQFGRANGGTVRAGQAYTVGEFGKEIFVPNTSGRIVPNNQMGGSVTINLNGIIDAEGARRAIERLLQDSTRRTAALNLAGSPL